MQYPDSFRPNPDDIVIVYQMPKVASTSVGEALRKHFRNVYVTHFMSGYTLPIYQKMVEYQGEGTLPIRTIKSIVSIINSTNEINKTFHAALDAGRKIKIITGVREPMDMSVSSIFHNIYTVTAFYEQMYDLDPISTEKIFTKLAQRFFENTYQNVPCENAVEMLMRMGINTTDWWFEQEFTSTLNVDLARYPFDYQQGYMIFAEGQLEIMVFRFEDRFRIMQEAVSKLVGIPNIEIPYENVAEKKGYAALYKAVKNSLVVPQNILDIKYNIPYVRHFYTEEEIASFRNKWSRAR